jgi:hypothetical protein
MIDDDTDSTAMPAVPLPENHPPLKAHQEWDAAEGCPVGRDPRHLTVAELEAFGRERTPALRTIRLKCLDCCCGSPAEVRRCGDVKCPNWPYRMGTDPWRAPPTEEAREQARQRFHALRHKDRTEEE